MIKRYSREKRGRMRRIRKSIGCVFLNRWSVHALLEWCYLRKDLRRQVRGSLEKGIRFPNKWFCPWKWKSFRHSTWNSLGQNTEMGSLSLEDSPGNLPNPGIEPRSPALQADSLPAEPRVSLSQSFVKRSEAQKGDSYRSQKNSSGQQSMAEPRRYHMVGSDRLCSLPKKAFAYTKQNFTLTQQH